LGWLLFIIVALLFALSQLWPGRARRAHAIEIDGKLVCWVKDEQVAREVYEEILQEKKGSHPGKAVFAQNWSDYTGDPNGEAVLSKSEAKELLAPMLTAQVQGYALMLNGEPVAVFETEQQAQNVLDKLKARYVKPEEGAKVTQRLEPEVPIQPVTVPPGRLTTDEDKAVELLQSSEVEERTHTVAKGETGQIIAAKYGVDVKQLARLNPDKADGILGKPNSWIHPGDILRIPGRRRGVVVVTEKEYVEEREIPYGTLEKRRTGLAPGERKVQRRGRPGLKRVRIRRTMHNDRKVKEEVLSEQVVRQPEAEIVLVPVKRPARRQPPKRKPTPPKPKPKPKPKAKPPTRPSAPAQPPSGRAPGPGR
ncbi:MAG: G5 domain-containing protein, partial [Armatimonadota bacterium]